jgi:hypothetical protein
MTRASILAITTLVWTAGFAATGAFVYTVSQESIPKPTIRAATPPPQPSFRAFRAAPPPAEPTLIVLPNVEIVGSLPAPAKPKATPAQPRPRHCSEWRPLEQGSASVQICD